MHCEHSDVDNRISVLGAKATEVVADKFLYTGLSINDPNACV
jgi:hypothetical protein